MAQHEMGFGGWRLLLTVLSLALVLFALYVLSSGPAALFLCYTESGTSLWNRVYWPLMRSVDGTPLHSSFSLYLSWWVNLTH